MRRFNACVSLAVVVGVALSLTACADGSTATKSGTRASSTASTVTDASPSSTEATAAPVSLGQVENAQVPAMCGHHAGQLVDGSLQGLDPEVDGALWLETYERGQLDGAGEVLAAQFLCHHGGVMWPADIAVFGSGGRVLGIYETQELGDGRQTVEQFRFENGRLEADVVGTLGEDDAYCCGRVDATVTLEYVGGAVVDTAVETFDETALAGQIVDAVNAEDMDAIAELAATDSAYRAMDMLVNWVAITDTYSLGECFAWSEFPTEEPLSSENVACRVYDASPGGMELPIAGIYLSRTGFGQWAAVDGEVVNDY